QATIALPALSGIQIDFSGQIIARNNGDPQLAQPDPVRNGLNGACRGRRIGLAEIADNRDPRSDALGKDGFDYVLKQGLIALGRVLPPGDMAQRKGALAQGLEDQRAARAGSGNLCHDRLRGIDTIARKTSATTNTKQFDPSVIAGIIVTIIDNVNDYCAPLPSGLSSPSMKHGASH